MRVPDYVHGCISPTFTAFHEDGTLDDQGQRNLLDYMLQAGSVSAYFIRSGMGQMYAFEMDDVKQLTSNVCAHLAGKAPVLVGCNGVWERDYNKRPDRETFLNQGIELALHAGDAGAAGVVYTLPEAWALESKDQKADLFVEYFTRICEKVSVPVFMYQPPNTHPDYVLTPELLATLADIEGLAGVKASYSDGYYVYNLVRAVKDKEFKFICGHEGMFYAALYAGGAAVIGQGATITPQILRIIQDGFESGDRARALEAQDSTNLLIEAVGNPVDFFKHYVSEKGFPIKRAFRRYKVNPYGQDPTPQTPEQYAASKRVVESELERFGFNVL